MPNTTHYFLFQLEKYFHIGLHSFYSSIEETLKEFIKDDYFSYQNNYFILMKSSKKSGKIKKLQEILVWKLGKK